MASSGRRFRAGGRVAVTSHLRRGPVRPRGWGSRPTAGLAPVTGQAEPADYLASDHPTAICETDRRAPHPAPPKAATGRRPFLSEDASIISWVGGTGDRFIFFEPSAGQETSSAHSHERGNPGAASTRIHFDPHLRARCCSRTLNHARKRASASVIIAAGTSHHAHSPSCLADGPALSQLCRRSPFSAVSASSYSPSRCGKCLERSSC